MRPAARLVVVGCVAALSLVLVYNRMLEDDGLCRNDAQCDVDSEDSFMRRMGSRMKERMTVLRENCKRLGLRHSKSKLRDDIIVSSKYKTVFCQIPKTGITQWKHLFVAMTGANVEDKNFTYNFKKMFQIRGEEKDNVLLKKDWFTMTVVREPMERLVSAYRSKLEESGTTMWDFATRIQQGYGDKTDPNFARKRTPDFNTFVKYLVLNYPDSLHEDNPHWKKYSTLCQPCDFDYDVIGHQETIDEDSEYVLRKIGASPKLKLRPPYKNKTDDDLVLRYYSSVKPRDRVLQLYNLLLDDYLLYGYPPPPLLKQLFHTT